MYDGPRFKLERATSTPFPDRKEATLDLDLKALALPAYAEYVPLPGGLKIRDGALTTRLKLALVTEKDEPRTITLAGTGRLDRLDVARADASPLASARTIDATLANLDLVGRTIALERVSIDAPDLELRRDAAGTLELARLLGTDATPPGGAGATPSPPSAATSPPLPAKAWAYSVADLRVADGAIRIDGRGRVSGVSGAAVERETRRHETRFPGWPRHGRVRFRLREGRAFRRHRRRRHVTPAT